MSRRITTSRAMHDLGAAAWFGGALMGAVALNGASRDVSDPTERTQVASIGWARWAPVNAAAITAHAAGGLVVLLANRDRVARQAGVGANTTAKLVTTAAAIGTTAYSGRLGAQLLQEGRVASEGGTVPAEETPEKVADLQQRLRLLQWVTPVLVGVVIVLGSQQGEQQRAGQVARGVVRRAAGRS